MSYFKYKNVEIFLTEEINGSKTLNGEIQIDFEDNSYFDSLSGVNKYFVNNNFVNILVDGKTIIVNTANIVAVKPK